MKTVDSYLKVSEACWHRAGGTLNLCAYATMSGKPLS